MKSLLTCHRVRPAGRAEGPFRGAHTKQGHRRLILLRRPQCELRLVVPFNPGTGPKPGTVTTPRVDEATEVTTQSRLVRGTPRTHDRELLPNATATAKASPWSLWRRSPSRACGHKAEPRQTQPSGRAGTERLTAP